MSEKDLKINFRYLTGNIACMSVDSVSGKSVHNDINNEEAIIIFNSLVGEKENCRTVKTLLEENEQLQNDLDAAKSRTKELSEKIIKALEYMKDFTFEPLLTNEDRKLIMYNANLRNFERILKGEPNNENK